MLMSRRIAIIGAPLCDGERELGVEKAPGVSHRFKALLCLEFH
jgi:hypothetical protein